MERVALSTVDVTSAAKKAAEVLRAGGIVLYPTDTIYGLAVDAENEDALVRLKDLKGRERGKPISIIVPNVESIQEYGVMNEPARVLSRRFLPGPLTLVLPAVARVGSELTTDDTIGIRIPNDPFCLALAKEFGHAFTTTSANKAGEETPGTVSEILEQFGELASGIALAIDDGERVGRAPSTVVRCTNETPQILREGAISSQELLQVG